MKKQINLIFFLLLIFFVSCGGSSLIESPPEDDLPVVDIVNVFWENDDEGYIQFKTNDEDILTSTGRSIWTAEYDEDMTDDLIEVNVNKISGRSAYGFGAVFSIQEVPESDDSINTDNFYAVLINTNGYYRIVKVVDNVQHILSIAGSDENGWLIPEDSYGYNILYTGKNTLNRIKVVTRNVSGVPEFDIYFNDEIVYTFLDDFTDDDGESLPLFEYSKTVDKYGFIVTLGPDENFPNVPVDVRYLRN